MSNVSVNVYNRKRNKTAKTGDEETKLESSDTVHNVKEVNVLFGLIIFRVCNILLVQTWFVPDEYWQGPEIAHKMVFNYGFETWEWTYAIRGYTFPSMFAILFKCLQLFKADWTVLVIYIPRVLQAILAAFGEFYIYKFAKLVCSPGAARWVLLCHMTSWFMFYTCTRTLTNSMETAVISIALYYWQDAAQTDKTLPGKTSLYKALVLASLSCLVRPTALIMWLPLGISKLYNSQFPLKVVFKFILPVGCAALVFSIGLDSYFYNRLVLVQHNFLYYNIMQNIAEFYGTHPWHWYFTQGVPVVLGSHLLPFFIGINYSGKQLLKWLILILSNILVYSFLSHKEFRFILPIVPVFMVICGEGFHQVADVRDVKKDEDGGKSRPLQLTFLGKLLTIFLLVTNIPSALYTGLVHQRGTLDVMKALGAEVHRNNEQNVLFLMPCHSTPYYSYIHKNISMKFLDCSPSKTTGYIDEADQFYKHPIKWLNETYKNRNDATNLPTHIILFDVLLKDINSFLWEYQYTGCGQFFHTHFPSGRIASQVLVYCRKHFVK